MRHTKRLLATMLILIMATGCDFSANLKQQDSDQQVDASRIGYGPHNSSASELDEPPDWNQFLADILAADIADRPAMADSFLNLLDESEEYGFPLTVDAQAVYLYTGGVNSVNVPGDQNGWSPTADSMTLIPGTILWYRDAAYELDARLDYKFITNGSNWILDPRNPRQVSGGFGPNSELAMPGYVDPWEIAYSPEIPHGLLESFQFHSESLNNTRTVKVYTPPDYDPEGAYPAIYVHDGGEYITLGSMKNVLDNLIHGGMIEPIIAVFVNPVNRNEEYWLNELFMNMFVEELVPHVDSTWATDPAPQSRAVMGCSLGGLTSVYFAHMRPEVFGYAGGHSSAMWVNGNEMINTIAADDPTDVVYYLDAGTYEQDILQSSEQLRDVLLGKGNSVAWRVWHEGHSWGAWRAHIDDLLQTFYGINEVKE